MTWSDAARAAALEARRLHAQVRNIFEIKHPITPHPILTTKEYRNKLAGQLKRIRKGTSKMGRDFQYATHRSAATSTAMRNQIRSFTSSKKRR